MPETPFVQQRILLVDDNAPWRRLCALVLSQAGYGVETAADGLLAWEAIIANYYDLVVADIDMPRLNGLDLAARVRLAGLRLPILMLSGSPDRVGACDTAQLELAAVLQKPLSASELIGAVECALKPSAGANARALRFPPALHPLYRSRSFQTHWGLNE